MHRIVLGLLVFSPLLCAQERLGPETQTHRTGGLDPVASHAKMVVADDLVVDSLLSEPLVRQPVFLNFDERGRMWVVQYMQYPHPAGLTIVSRDQYWRNVYDQVPPAPPHHFPGKDQITIHEDTNGDGTFDSHKIFLDGLNMVTSIAHGRGGHWVLNPPYLLFYPDHDGDDVPDSAPVVHLSGFGLEDSHSIANSLRWGPDGWLYGAQGSTVTANIIRPGFDETPVYSQGQNIWRYHPKSRRYEVFAEGGGNAFGVEIDSAGRVFSGHNGGNTRGFHYPQGGYLRKGFTKHGPLSNPYAFGFFSGMPHHDVERFTHNFVIYDDPNLPLAYFGKLFGVEPLQGRVVVAEINGLGSSFQTTDIGHPLTSNDDWFRPVDIKVGPDGNIYVCDWYDGQVNHYRNHEGNIDVEKGRIYRLRAKGQALAETPNLGKVSSDTLVDYLSHPRRWLRNTARRVLGDRRDTSVAPRLKHTVQSESGQLALEAFWALNLIQDLDDETIEHGLCHDNPNVRTWAVRLLGDQHDTTFARRLAAMAKEERHLEVRQQLAAYARRSESGLPVIRALLDFDEDATDIYQPLMVWWALESHYSRDSLSSIRLFQDPLLWKKSLVQDWMLERLMKRCAMEGKRENFEHCAMLLRSAPNASTRQTLMKAFETAFQGRAVPTLPTSLVREIINAGGGSLALQIRLGDSKATAEGVQRISAANVDLQERHELIRLCAELKAPQLPDALFALIEDAETGADTRLVAIAALQNFPEMQIAERMIGLYETLSPKSQAEMQSVLATRAGWAKSMIEAAANGKLDPLSLSIDVLRKCLLFDLPELTAAIEEQWGQVKGVSSSAMKSEIGRITRLLQSRAGDVYQGQRLFRDNCGKCHKLFIGGGAIGPDLTAYQRTDVPNMVLNVVNPNAEIREGFENYLVLTDEGRAITGLMVERNTNVLVIRTPEGQDITIDRDTIEDARVLGRSLMPEGLLDSLTDEQIVNLFAYLRSTQPLNN